MSLQFNVSQLLKSSVGETRSFDFSSDEPLDLDGVVASDIHGHVKFTMTNYTVVADVEADALMDLTCARCLEQFAGPAHVSFTEEYQPQIDIDTGLPVTEVANSEAFAISSNHTIDLTEALRQHLLLAVELVPVCRPDCRGLCANCGTNLNRETCACPPAEPASPFATLQALLVESESER